MGFGVIPQKNGVNRWKHLRQACGLAGVGSNVPRRTAISNFYRHNPFTGQPVTDESLMVAQFGNSEDVRKSTTRTPPLPSKTQKGFGGAEQFRKQDKRPPNEQSFLKFLQFSETFFRLFYSVFWLSDSVVNQ